MVQLVFNELRNIVSVFSSVHNFHDTCAYKGSSLSCLLLTEANFPSRKEGFSVFLVCSLAGQIV